MCSIHVHRDEEIKQAEKRTLSSAMLLPVLCPLLPIDQTSCKMSRVPPHTQEREKRMSVIMLLQCSRIAIA